MLKNVLLVVAGVTAGVVGTLAALKMGHAAPEETETEREALPGATSENEEVMNNG